MAGLLAFRFGHRWRRRAYRRKALDEPRAMGRNLRACRASEARAICDAPDGPVVACQAVCIISALCQCTCTMLFVYLARLHVRSVHWCGRYIQRSCSLASIEKSTVLLSGISERPKPWRVHAVGRRPAISRCQNEFLQCPLLWNLSSFQFHSLDPTVLYLIL